MLGGVVIWNSKIFIFGAIAGVVLGVIASVWGFVEWIIGQFRLGKTAPVPTQVEPLVYGPGSLQAFVPGSPPIIGPDPTPVPIQPPKSSGGSFAMLLGGGSIAAILTTLVVIVGIVVGLGFAAFWILAWLLEKIPPGTNLRIW